MPKSEGRWSKKRKFYGKIPKHVGKGNNSKKNGDSEHVNFEEVRDVSASCSKIENNLNDSFSDMEDSSSGYKLFSVSVINDILKNSLCSSCKEGNHQIQEDLPFRRGWASKLVHTCTNVNCSMEKEYFTSERTANNLYDVNIRLVYDLRCIGKGDAAAELFSSIMNLPPPVTNFQRYNRALHEAVKSVAEDSMQEAGKECKEINKGDADIAVTNDGTWMRRGHTFLFGAANIIALNNGKVLDTHLCSKYYHSCNVHKNDDKNSFAYQHWAKSHAKKCGNNYQGTSGGMEVAATIEMFSRSINKHGLRYVKYIGDGDSRAYKAVCETKPYGATNIVKLECVGHIQKRMESRLRQLCKNYKGKKLSDGKCLSGKDRLTDKQIDSLQYYYGQAIRSNTDNLSKMKQAVWATFLHKASTDDNPQHFPCPKDDNTWCKYNRFIQTRGTYTHQNHFPSAVTDVIKPVYKDLANPELLEKCLHGKTQNVNESLNAMIWERCPKTGFASKKTV